MQPRHGGRRRVTLTFRLTLAASAAEIDAHVRMCHFSSQEIAIRQLHCRWLAERIFFLIAGQECTVVFGLDMILGDISSASLRIRGLRTQ